MNYRILLLLGKILIITTLFGSTFTVWLIGVDANVWPSFISCTLHILAGILLCIYASKHISNKQAQQVSISDTLIHPFFQIVKWCVIAAISFQLIAAIIIVFFYCLKHEFEATLCVCTLSGFFIVFVIKAIEYYKDYKDQITN